MCTKTWLWNDQGQHLNTNHVVKEQKIECTVTTPICSGIGIATVHSIKYLFCFRKIPYKLITLISDEFSANDIWTNIIFWFLNQKYPHIK